MGVRNWFLGMLLVVVLTATVSGESEPTVGAGEQLLRSHIEFLNEMSERRRVNVLFPNEQVAHYGLPFRYVNSAKGNFTFVRRDLVAVGRIPIVLARVYDSSLQGNGPFGPGWHLTLAESIGPGSKGQLVYVDDSGAEIALTQSGSSYAPLLRGPTDIKQIESRGAYIVVSLQDGWTKSFSKFADRYALTSIKDRHGNVLSVRYRDGRPVRVEGHKGRFIDIFWNAAGKIGRVVDDQNREVKYLYDQAGRLDTVVDLGQHSWRHKYGKNGKLEQITDPRKIVSAEVGYDALGNLCTGRRECRG